VIEIRRATPDDARAIAKVNAEAGRAGWASFLPASKLAEFEAPVERWRDRLARPWPVFVATEQDVVVGFISLGPDEGDTSDDDVGQVSALYVHPQVWGGAVGRRLLERGLDELRRRGCRAAVLWTEQRNERPRRFYAAAGWRLDGAARERVFLGAPIREVRYRLELGEEAKA
jgi:GNAT superfamily N-acetyltransferase